MNAAANKAVNADAFSLATIAPGTTRVMRTNSFTISRRDFRRLQERALRAQRQDQTEICGVLVKRGQHLELMFLQNLSERRGSFEMSRAAIAAQRTAARARRGRVVGTFHWSSPEFTDTSEKPHTRQGGVSWSNGERTAKSLSRKPSS